MRIRSRALPALLTVCLLAALCAGCAGKTGETQTPAPQAAAGTETPASAPETKTEPEGKTPYADAFAAYLDVLAENREAILAYDWQKGVVYDAERYETALGGTPRQVAVADVWGDETPELLYIAAEKQDGCYIFARLHLVTFEDGAARELGERFDLSLDGQVGGGMNYRLFQTESDKGLWLYKIYYSEGFDETYTHLTAAGELKTLFDCSHSRYLTESAAGEWSETDEWERLGAKCSREAYESEVPLPEEQAKGLLMRNAMGYEYDEDWETPADAFAYPEGAAKTYDEAVAYLRGELGITPDETVDEGAFFASLPKDFSFLSGVGGWSSELSLSPDGTFTGDYHDSDMGDTGEGYPDGTIYVCSFSGRFGDVRRVDDYTYSMRLLAIDMDPAPAGEWIEDDIRWVAAAPYGLEDADEIMVYLPGSWVRGLPYDFVSWVAMPRAWGGWDDRPVLLPFCGLYNVAAQEGWSSGE